jgi:hypothetical protein
MPEEEGRSKFIAILNEGFAMGEHIIADNWYINKTFLALSAPESKMTSVEKQIFTALVDHISILDKTKDKERYEEISTLLKRLSPNGYEKYLTE